MTNVSFQHVKAERSDYGHQFEILVAHLIRSLVQPGDTVVDGGANSGLHTPNMATAVGRSGCVYAVEPIPAIFQSLEQGMRQWLWVHCELAALTDRNVEAIPFLLNEQRPGLSQLAVAPGHEQAPEDLTRIMVRGISLDSLVRRRPVSLVKLDLEGGEFRCLQGAADILRCDRPLIVFENARSWAGRQYGYTADEFLGFFATLGYRICDIHCAPLDRRSWESTELGFEFVAGHADDERFDRAMDICRSFWREIPSRPVITEWIECARRIRNMDGFFPDL